MEAVPTADITANAGDVQNGKSSLGYFATALQCAEAGCISGKANMIPRNFTVHTATTDLQNGTVTGSVGGVGRFGLRANGVEILQFIVGGLQGELSFTSLFNGAEIVFPTLFPGRDHGNHRAVGVCDGAFGNVRSAGKRAASAAFPSTWSSQSQHA
jgi:hypothetical protein